MTHEFMGDSIKFKAISDGTIAFDGGMMYGVVPKVFWEKWHDVDDLNRIRLGMWCLVVEHPDGLIVVDTGCGDKIPEKMIEIFDLDRPEGDFHAGFVAAGYDPLDVVAVILTHLHFDHNGGVTKAEEGGYEHLYPLAKVYTTEREYHDATNINERTKGNYYPSTLEGLDSGGRLVLVEGEEEILPGVLLLPAPGHTLGHQIVLFTDGDTKFAAWGDLIPMSTLSPVSYVAAIDNYPLITIEQKEKYLARARDENWHQFFYHNVETPFEPPPAP